MPDSYDKLNTSVMQVCHLWGWKNPTENVVGIASECLSMDKERCGDTLVRWGLLPREKIEALIKIKPGNLRTLEFLMQEATVNIAPHVEKILTLEKGYPYYTELGDLDQHPSLSDDNFADSVSKRCEEIDAIFMSIEGTIGVLVFSQFEKLNHYSTLGSQRHNDALFKANNDVAPLLAVGPRDEISRMIKHFTRRDKESSESQAKILSPSSPSMQTEEGRALVRIFDDALECEATDILFKPIGYTGRVQVQLRRFGRLIDPFRPDISKDKRTGKARDTRHILTYGEADKMFNLLGQQSGANPHFHVLRVPSDGSMAYKSRFGSAFFRLGFMPLNRMGEIRDIRSLAIRVFSKTKQSIDFAKLNVPADIAEQITFAMRAPQGFVLISGPVNSGKSSLIAAAINVHVKEFGNSVHRISLEDPVEREVEGVTQFNLPSERQMDTIEAYNVMMKGSKRHDFNLFWLGEVRDRLGAEFCTTIAGSGHLALSTLHAKDSIVAYDMLSEMIDPGQRFQLAESMSMSISTRLLRTICPHCSIKNDTATEDEKKMFSRCCANLGDDDAELPQYVNRANHEGCQKCDEGYNGFAPIFEVLDFNRQVKDAAISMLNRQDMGKQRKLMAEARSITLMQSAIRLLKQGLVDIPTIIIS